MQEDVWSVGVMVFYMLVGIPHRKGHHCPGPGVLKGSPRFQALSEPAKDFITSVLQVDPDTRPTARNALNHPWLRNRKQAEDVVMDQSILGRMRTFARSTSFQRKVLSLMAWSLSLEEIECLRTLFLAIDTEMSGSIDVHEFKSVLADSFPMQTAQESEAIFKGLDTDGDGRIHYSDFLAAVMPGNAKGRDDLLRRAFARFDRDGDGKVSRGELRSVLGKSCTASEIEDLLREDVTGEGKLNYQQFQAKFLHRPGPAPV